MGYRDHPEDEVDLIERQAEEIRQLKRRVLHLERQWRQLAAALASGG